MAPNRAVHGEAALAGLAPRDGEFVRQVLGRAEVHLVGRLAGERRMRHLPVVLLEEEGDQRFEMSHGVERVQVEPLMLERSPPSLDDRIRPGDLDLRQNAAELRGAESGVHRVVDVLDAGVGDDCGASVRGHPLLLVQVLACGDEHSAGCDRVEACGKGPGEDSPEMVVEHGMKVRLGAVEQLEDDDVDVPVPVRAARAHADGGLGWVHAHATATPTVLTHGAGPGGDGHEDLARPLSEEAERAQGHVTQAGVEHPILDGGDLLARELTGSRARTRCPVVEAAAVGRAVPGVIARWGDTDDLVDQHERKHRLGAGDRAQQPGLVVACGKSLARETEPGGSQQREQEPDDGGEDLLASSQLLDPVGCNNSIDRKSSRIDVVQAVIAHRLELAAAARLSFSSPGMNLYFQFLVLMLAGWVNRHQQSVIEYLQAENRALCEQLGPRRIRWTDEQRRRLAEKAKAVGRDALMQLGSISAPDTLLRWYRKLVAAKYDGSARRGPGRPRVKQSITELVVEMARSCPSWGTTRIRGALHNLGHDVARNTIKNTLLAHGLQPAPERGKRTSWRTLLQSHLGAIAGADFFTVEVLTPFGLIRTFVLFVIDIGTRRVHIAGITSQPSDAWMKQIARNLTDAVDGFLIKTRTLILDRDPLYTRAFREILKTAGVKVVRLPARSPNLNAFAERFVQTVKSECLARVIPLGEQHLRHMLTQYVEHYHKQRNHQGLGNQLIEPLPANSNAIEGAVRRRERLGGVLSYYYRAAA